MTRTNLIPLKVPLHRNRWLKRLREAPWALDEATFDHLLDWFKETGQLSRSERWEMIERRVAWRIRHTRSWHSRLYGQLLLAIMHARFDEVEKLKARLARLKKQQGASS